MNMERMKYLAIVLLAISLVAYGRTGSASSHVKQVTACMLRVLKAEPGVSYPREGVSTVHGVTRPYVEYRASEGSRWGGPTRFTLQQSNVGHLSFMAVLPGMLPIDTHVTNTVMKQWKAKCHVDANILFQ